MVASYAFFFNCETVVGSHAHWFSYRPFQCGSSIAIVLCLCVGGSICDICCPYLFLISLSLWCRGRIVILDCDISLRKHACSNIQKISDKNYDIFHISAQNIDCWYSLEPPRQGGSNEYQLSMFLSSNKKNNVYPL